MVSAPCLCAGRAGEKRSEVSWFCSGKPNLPIGETKNQLHSCVIFGYIYTRQGKTSSLLTSVQFVPRALPAHLADPVKPMVDISGKIHTFSSELLKYLISLQLVLISVHKYIPSNMINASDGCSTLFSKCLNVLPKPVIPT